MDVLKKNLNQVILHREQQIIKIIQLLGVPIKDSNPVSIPQSVFVYGHDSTGKKFVVTEVVKALNYRHAVVNCLECYTQKILFEPILNQLTRHTICSDNNYAPYAKCDNMMDFIYSLQEAANALKFSKDLCVIALENCERLRDLDTNLLPAFLRLQEMTNLNVCVILLSDIVFEKFILKSSLLEPFEVFFPQYTQDEIIDILFLNRHNDYPDDFYRNYINLLVSVLYRECRNLNELQRMASLNFPKYSEPVASGRLELSDANKLWRHLQPHLKTSIDELHLRTKMWSGPKDLHSVKHELVSTAKHALNYELPYYTKYLLIAAYLASYNPEKTDKRIFFKSTGKQKKKRFSNKDKKLRDHNLGPKLFSLDRLLAIFYTILGEKLTLTVNLQSQVSSLVSLKLLTLVSEECLESPKLKCAVGLVFIKIIAQTVQFNVTKYLYNLS